MTTVNGTGFNITIKKAQLESREDMYQAQIVELENEMSQLLTLVYDNAPPSEQPQLASSMDSIYAGFDAWYEKSTNIDEATQTRVKEKSEKGVRQLAQAWTDYSKSGFSDTDATGKMAAVKTAMSNIKAALGVTRSEIAAVRQEEEASKSDRKSQNELTKA